MFLRRAVVMIYEVFVSPYLVSCKFLIIKYQKQIVYHSRYTYMYIYARMGTQLKKTSSISYKIKKNTDNRMIVPFKHCHPTIGVFNYNY